METKNNTHTISTLAALAGLALAAGSAHAAIAVTGGDFEIPDIGATTQPGDIPMWFDNDVPYAASHNGEGYTSNGSQSAILYSGDEIGYMYQSLGTLDAGTTSLDWSFDQLSKTYSGGGDGTGDVRFFYGTDAGAGNGADIDTLVGLTQIGSTISIPNLPGGVDTLRSGSVDVSSVAEGSTIWMDFTQTSGFLLIDNVSVTAAVPEPSTTALLGLGGLALILRRRK
jgi:hypothetical protein